MSIESAKAFIKRMNTDEDFAKKVSKTQRREDLIKLASDHGFDFTHEEFEPQLKPLYEELADAELDVVSGGNRSNAIAFLEAYSWGIPLERVRTEAESVLEKLRDG